MNDYNTYSTASSAYPQTSTPEKQVVEIRPKLGGFLFSYILFSIPGFFAGLIWLLISVVILFGALGSLFSSDSLSNDSLSLSTVQPSSSTQDGILIYDLQGAIDTGSSVLPSSARSTGIYTELVKEDFEKIKKNSNIKNVVFRINTPGGSVFASEVLGDLIADLIQAKGQSQSVFYYDQVVASGGLWASLKNTNNYIVANQYGETGSIGVLLEIPNLSKLAENVGYRQTTIKSSPSKDYGSAFRDLSEAERNFLQKQVDDKYQQFVEVVATGRKLTQEKVREIGNGYVYPNRQAREFGLVDDLGDVNKAVSRAAANAALSNYNVWEITPVRSALDEFLSNSSLGSVLGATNKTAQIVDKATFIQPGVVYALDETKF